MPYRQNFPIPTNIDAPLMCLQLQIPDDPTWKAVVAGLLMELSYWFNWERTGDNSGSLCAARWKPLFNQIDWSNMSCCCGEFDVIFRWTEDGVLEQSTDDGTTWTDASSQDPRNSSPVYPPVAGEPSDDKKCTSATGMTLLIKEQVGDNLTDDMSRFTLGELISTWITSIIQSSNPFQALINIAVAQIFALTIALIRPALTTAVYDQLTCIFYCNMDDDLSFDNAGWDTVRSDITSQIAGIAGVFLEHLVYLLGKVGLTNLARSQAATSGDCSDCGCEDTCVDMWAIFNGAENYGEIVEVGVNYIIANLFLAPSTVGEYFLRMKTPGVDDCCNIDHIEILSGGIINLANCAACGHVQDGSTTGSFDPDAGVGNINMFYIGSAGAMQVKIFVA